VSARSSSNENIEGGEQNLARIERERDVVAGSHQELPPLFEDASMFEERSSPARLSPMAVAAFPLRLVDVARKVSGDPRERRAAAVLAMAKAR
jgi:hypothetical protein